MADKTGLKKRWMSVFRKGKKGDSSSGLVFPSSSLSSGRSQATTTMSVRSASLHVPHYMMPTIASSNKITSKMHSLGKLPKHSDACSGSKSGINTVSKTTMRESKLPTSKNIVDLKENIVDDEGVLESGMNTLREDNGPLPTSGSQQNLSERKASLEVEGVEKNTSFRSDSPISSENKENLWSSCVKKFCHLELQPTREVEVGQLNIHNPSIYREPKSILSSGSENDAPNTLDNTLNSISELDETLRAGDDSVYFTPHTNTSSILITPVTALCSSFKKSLVVASKKKSIIQKTDDPGNAE